MILAVEQTKKENLFNPLPKEMGVNNLSRLNNSLKNRLDKAGQKIDENLKKKTERLLKGNYTEEDMCEAYSDILEEHEEKEKEAVFYLNPIPNQQDINNSDEIILPNNYLKFIKSKLSHFDAINKEIKPYFVYYINEIYKIHCNYQELLDTEKDWDILIVTNIVYHFLSFIEKLRSLDLVKNPFQTIVEILPKTQIIEDLLKLLIIGIKIVSKEIESKLLILYKYFFDAIQKIMSECTATLYNRLFYLQKSDNTNNINLDIGKSLCAFIINKTIFMLSLKENTEEKNPPFFITNEVIIHPSFSEMFYTEIIKIKKELANSKLSEKKDDNDMIKNILSNSDQYSLATFAFRSIFKLLTSPIEWEQVEAFLKAKETDNIENNFFLKQIKPLISPENINNEQILDTKQKLKNLINVCIEKKNLNNSILKAFLIFLEVTYSSSKVLWRDNRWSTLSFIYMCGSVNIKINKNLLLKEYIPNYKVFMDFNREENLNSLLSIIYYYDCNFLEKKNELNFLKFFIEYFISSCTKLLSLPESLKIKNRIQNTILILLENYKEKNDFKFDVSITQLDLQDLIEILINILKLEATKPMNSSLTSQESLEKVFSIMYYALKEKKDLKTLQEMLKTPKLFKKPKGEFLENMYKLIVFIFSMKDSKISYYHEVVFILWHLLPPINKKLLKEHKIFHDSLIERLYKKKKIEAIEFAENAHLEKTPFFLLHMAKENKNTKAFNFLINILYKNLIPITDLDQLCLYLNNIKNPQNPQTLSYNLCKSSKDLIKFLHVRQTINTGSVLALSDFGLVFCEYRNNIKLCLEILYEIYDTKIQEKKQKQYSIKELFKIKPVSDTDLQKIMSQMEGKEKNKNFNNTWLNVTYSVSDSFLQDSVLYKEFQSLITKYTVRTKNKE